MDLTHFQFENRSREQHVADSSKHSLCLMKLLRDTAEGISTHNTHVHVYVYVFVYVYVSVYVYMYVYVHVYVFESVSVCAHENVNDLPQWFHVILANISYRYKHIKTCHHESSRTPQHSK